MNPYHVLGIEEKADTATIKEAYRQLARKHHPDRGGDVAKFKEATEAYSILSDEQKRHQYHNPPQRSSFDSVFGQGFNPFADLFSFHAPEQQRVKLHTEDEDIQFNFQVSLDQIKKGATSTITYKRNKICDNCNGEGGHGRKGCITCGGSGRKMFKPNPQTIQQVVCHTCYGKGISFDQPCQICQTQGFVSYTEQVAVYIEELRP